jgi:hypothetical protein
MLIISSRNHTDTDNQCGGCIMKDDVTYNHANNNVFVRTNGDLIYVICNKEDQQKKVIEKMCTDNCILEDYEEWDENEDKKWILTFRVLDEYEKRLDYN